MSSSTLEELSRVKETIEQGNYMDALQQLEAITSKKGLSEEDLLACKLLESHSWMKLGEFHTALHLTQELQQAIRGQDKQLPRLDLSILQAEIFWRTNRFDEGFLAVRLGEELLDGITSENRFEQEEAILSRKGDLFLHKGYLFTRENKLDKALELHQRTLEIFSKLDDKRGIADALHGLGTIYWSKGELDKALDYNKQSLAIRQVLGNQRDIASSLTSLGCIYQWEGDLDQAFDYTKHSLTIKQELGNKQDIALSLSNLGVIYLCKGDYDQALKCYQESLAICKEIDDQWGLTFVLHNLGEISMEKGELDQSLGFFQESLEISNKIGNDQITANLLLNRGIVYRLKGEHSQALADYQHCLVIYEEIGNDPSTAVVLYHLIRLAIEMNDHSLTKHYLQKLQDIHLRSDNRVIDHRYRIATALSLRTSKRARDKLKAQEILEGVVKEELTDHSLTVTAMIHLSDLLLLELKMTGEEDVLNEIKHLTQRLHEMAERLGSHSLLIETLLLQSKFALIEFDVDQAKRLLTNAQGMAEEKGLLPLSQMVGDEYKQLLSQLDKWEQMVEGKPTREERINSALSEDLLERMIRKTVALLSDEDKRILGEELPKPKYILVHKDLLSDSQKVERSRFRVGLAQIGLSEAGDILHEFYEEGAPGLFGLRKEKLKEVRATVKNIVERASSERIDLLIFPELTIDLNLPQLLDDIQDLSQTYNIHIIPGSYHNPKTKQNLSQVISPKGILWEQEKHIPAIIHFMGERLNEGIEIRPKPRKVIVGTTEFGRIAIVICRDFLDMDLRVELKNCEPPIDILINPAFTPVTADFRAAHFDARRSIYAYCFFANVAEFGDSLIYTPEKERIERSIPGGEENLIYKDVDLFQLRSERKKWEIEQRKTKSFIQSTR